MSALRSETERRCQAATQAGERCRLLAQPGSLYCHLHDGAADNGRIVDAADTAALRRQLAAELDGVVNRLRDGRPDYEPPPFSPGALLDLIRQGVARSPELETIRQTLADATREDLVDPDTWKGLAYMLGYSLRHQSQTLRDRLGGAITRRLPPEVQRWLHEATDEAFDIETWRGLWYLLNYAARPPAERETDAWGLDRTLVEATRPFLTFLYRAYWRVTTTGLANVPDEGPALLVGGAAGRLPFDAAMVEAAVALEHPASRLVRTLYDPSLNAVPFISTLLSRLGQAAAGVENGRRLLDGGELVAVYPDKYHSADSFHDERALADFSRGGFVAIALRAGAPIIPVAIDGAGAGGLLRPGPLAAVPLPGRWSIAFGRPIVTADYDPSAADDLLLALQLAERVRVAVAALLAETRA